MTGYTKLFASILASTIWLEDDRTRIVWIAMMAMADRHGRVDASVPGLAAMARVSLPACRRALDTLQAPDAHSRTKADDGRRIRPVDGGWVLVNHAKYRGTMAADDRRDYMREKQREHRARVRAAEVDPVKLSTRSTPRQRAVLLTSSEAEADPEAEDQKPVPRASARPAPLTIGDVRHHLQRVAHDALDAQPSLCATDLGETVKDAAAKLGVEYSHGRVQRILEAVYAARERRRA